MNNIIESAECTVVTKRLINNAIENLTLEQIKALYVQKGGDLGELIGEQIIHAKPVGIAIQSSMYKRVTLSTFDANSVPVGTKLYTKPINPDDVAKDGYVLVPIEPTDEMIEAGRLQGKLNELEFRLRDEGARLIYKAMLASNGKG